MNKLQCAGVVLSSILVANCAATAKNAKKSAEAPAPSISIQLCREMGAAIGRVGVQTLITLGDGEKDVDQKQPIGEAADNVSCAYSPTVDVMSNIQTLTPDALYIDEALGGSSIPGVVEEVKPPYQFVDFSRSSTGDVPDGIADNLCSALACVPVQTLGADQRHFVQERFSQLVNDTLKRYRGNKQNPTRSR